MRWARGLAGLGETLLGLRAARDGFHWLLAVAVMLAAAPPTPAFSN